MTINNQKQAIVHTGLKLSLVLCLLLGGFITGFNLQAQDTEIELEEQEDLDRFRSKKNAPAMLEDVVYLKNGSIIRGEVVELVPNEFVKIEIMGGSIFAYPMSEVERIAKEEMGGDYGRFAVRNPRQLRPRRHKNEGWYGLSSVSFMPGEGHDGWFYMGVNAQQVLGYQYNQRAAVGVGLGLDSYITDGFYTLFGEFRGYLKDKSGTPYYSVQAGYGGFISGWNAQPESKGGLFVSPEIGLRMPTRGKMHFTMGIGAKFQGAEIHRQEWDWQTGQQFTTIDDLVFQRYVVRFGFLF